MLLNEKIKLLRTSNQLSQESIAILLEVSRQSVSKWEKGLSNPSTENLIRLSEIFSISVEDLIDENLQISKYYKPLPFFSEILKRKSFIIAIMLSLLLFIILFICALCLKNSNYPVSLFLASLSAIFAFLAYLLFLFIVLKYVYLDCRMRKIRPFWYVLISITIVGFVFYLLRRDEISKFN